MTYAIPIGDLNPSALGEVLEFALRDGVAAPDVDAIGEFLSRLDWSGQGTEDLPLAPLVGDLALLLTAYQEDDLSLEEFVAGLFGVWREAQLMDAAPITNSVPSPGNRVASAPVVTVGASNELFVRSSSGDPTIIEVALLA